MEDPNPLEMTHRLKDNTWDHNYIIWKMFKENKRTSAGYPGLLKA